MISGGSASVVELPVLYTFFDVLLIIISSFLLAVSATYLLLTSKVPEVYKDGERDLKITLRTLKGDERTVYEAVINEGGAIFQSDLVERVGLPKSTVSLILDKLEARDLLERKRCGMSNIVIAKSQPRAR